MFGCFLHKDIVYKINRLKVDKNYFIGFSVNMHVCALKRTHTMVLNLMIQTSEKDTNVVMVPNRTQFENTCIIEEASFFTLCVVSSWLLVGTE